MEGQYKLASFYFNSVYFCQGCEGLADSGPDRGVRQAGPGERPARDQPGALDDARHRGEEEVGRWCQVAVFSAYLHKKCTR
jgi:hypothetical protein